MVSPLRRPARLCFVYSVCSTAILFVGQTQVMGKKAGLEKSPYVLACCLNLSEKQPAKKKKSLNRTPGLRPVDGMGALPFLAEQEGSALQTNPVIVYRLLSTEWLHPCSGKPCWLCGMSPVFAQSLTLPLQDQAVGPKQDFEEEGMTAVLKWSVLPLLGRPES